MYICTYIYVYEYIYIYIYIYTYIGMSVKAQTTAWNSVKKIGWPSGFDCETIKSPYLCLPPLQRGFECLASAIPSLPLIDVSNNSTSAMLEPLQEGDDEWEETLIDKSNSTAYPTIDYSDGIYIYIHIYIVYIYIYARVIFVVILISP
jgi:hypothetical protein